MKKTFIKKRLFVCIATLLAAASSFAQTITTGAIAPAAVCAGSEISVSFTTTGTYVAGNVFTAELSTAAGTFPGTTLATSGTASPLTAVIPPATVAGGAYKVRVVSSNPVAATTTPSAAITINAIPASPTLPAPPSYVTGASASALTATGTGLLWYTAASGGTGLPTAPTPTTATAGVQNFWVTQTVTGCESARAQLTVTVTACTPPAAPAVAPVSYTVGQTPVALTATGTGLLWYTAASGGTGSPTAPTPTTATAGVQNFWVTQTVTGCESARAQITVTVTPCTPPAAPAVAPVSYTVGQTPVALTATGTGLLWYTAASGGTGSPTAPTPTTATAGVQNFWVTQTVTGCESARAQLTVTVTACTPPVAPAVAPVSYTVGQTPVALTATGTGLLWYTAASGGTGLPTAPTPTTATAGVQNFWVTQTVTGCESARAQLTVTVTACTPPAAPAVAPVSYTVGQTPVALTATGTGLLWYTAASGGTGSPTAPTPTTATAGVQNFWVTQTVTGCESARAQLTVTVSACTPPSAPVVAPVSYTVGQTPVALTATGTGLLWYTAASGGTGSPTAPTPTTATAGTQNFWVTQTVSGCESARAQITVTVSACTPPAAPTVSNVKYCLGSPTVALTAAGSNLKWYTASAGGVGTSIAPLPSSGSVGTVSYWVTQTIGVCESSRAKIDVTVSQTAPPVVTAENRLLKYCLGETPTALVASGSYLKWYKQFDPSIYLVAPVPSPTAVGSTIYNVTQTVDGCESQPVEIIVVISNVVPPAPDVANTSLNYCKGALDVPALSTIGATNPKWYTTSSSTSPLSQAPTPSASSVGMQSFFVSQTTDICESPRQEIKITIKDISKNPVVTSPSEYCAETIASPLAATGTGVLAWYNESGVLPGAPTPVTATGTSPKVYFVTQTETGKCESVKEDGKITITVNPLPAALTAVSEALCQEKQSKIYAFSATPGTGNTINWYQTLTGGVKETAAPTYDLVTAGEKTYYVVQATAKGCESPVRVANKLRVKPLPALPSVTSPPAYCQFNTASPLSATPQASAVLNWYGTNASGGTPSDVAPVPSTQTGGTTSYYVGQTLEGCVGDRARIDVTINTTPVPTIATPTVAYCQNAPATALSAQGTNLKWYATSEDPNPRTTALIPFTEKVEDYSFYVTQTGSNTCESPKAEIKIHIKARPTATISGNTSIDLGQSANLTLNFTAEGPWKYVLSNGVTGTSTEPTVNIPVSPVTTTSYSITEISNSCGNGSPNGSARVTVRIPTITSGNPSVAEACAGKTFTVPFQQSGEYPVGNRFNVQISLVNEDSQFYTIPSVATVNSITATFPDTTRGGNYFVRVVSSGSNPAFLVRGSVSQVGITAVPLPVATLSGSKTILMGESADLKVEFAGRSPWTFSLNNGVKDSLITASSAPYSFMVKPKLTTTYTITSVTNGCGTGKGAGSARIQVDPILGVEPPVTNWLKVYPTVVESKCTVEIENAISTKGAKVEIIDMNGRAVFEQPIRMKNTEVDFTGYPSGLYLLRVQNGNLHSVNRVMKP